MTNFTKDELKTLHEFLDHACKNYQEPDDTYDLRDKIQSIIDNYSCEDEIFSSNVGLTLNDDFFCIKQDLTDDDMLPIIYELVNKCNGMIKQAGSYVFKLRVVKLK